jgi:hypothetical protein
MTVPFLVEYGILFGDQASIDEAAKQLLVYARHLQGPAPGCCITPMMKPGGRRGLNPARVTLGSFGAARWAGMEWPSCMRSSIFGRMLNMPSC